MDFDACGMCGGDNACLGCDGVPNSGKVVDSCGVCGGSNGCLEVCEGTILSSCTEDCGSLTDPKEQFLCGLDMCGEEYVDSKSILSPSNSDVSDSYGFSSHFGELSNDLAPKYGGSYAMLSNGLLSSSYKSNSLGGGGVSDTYVSNSPTIYDVVEFQVEMTAPEDAQGFALDYIS